MPTGRFRISRVAPWLALVVCVACNRGASPAEHSNAAVPPGKMVPLAKVDFHASPDRPADSSEAQMGSLKLRLEHPDHADHPTAWEGPLDIQDGSASCQSDVSLVTAVYASPDAPTLVVISYSGSLTYVDFVDKSCKHTWPQIKAFTEGVQTADGLLTILPGCEGSGAKGPAQCSAAQVFKFDGRSQPELDRSESLALTRRVVGVAFDGTKKVQHPKNPDAKLVE